MESMREKMKSVIGTNSSLSDRQMVVIDDLCNLVRLDGLRLAQDMDSAVNSFGLNERLFGEAIACIDGEYIHGFVKYLVFQFVTILANNFKKGVYDLRNEDACKNACEIEREWVVCDVDLPMSLADKARQTANYWCVYTHRTLQQSIMRVFLCYMQRMASEDSDFQRIVNSPLRAMRFI